MRRALAKQGEDLYIIESVNRESLYDFSEALADLGISEQFIQLVEMLHMLYRNSENEQLYEHGDNNKFNYPTINYIIFRKGKNH